MISAVIISLIFVFDFRIDPVAIEQSGRRRAWWCPRRTSGIDDRGFNRPDTCGGLGAENS